MSKLCDEDTFPFGRFQRSMTKMKDVPASYLDWLVDQPWMEKWPAVLDYIARNRKLIDVELQEQGLI